MRRKEQFSRNDIVTLIDRKLLSDYKRSVNCDIVGGMLPNFGYKFIINNSVGVIGFLPDGREIHGYSIIGRDGRRFCYDERLFIESEISFVSEYTDMFLKKPINIIKIGKESVVDLIDYTVINPQKQKIKIRLEKKTYNKFLYIKNGKNKIDIIFSESKFRLKLNYNINDVAYSENNGIITIITELK